MVGLLTARVLRHEPFAIGELSVGYEAGHPVLHGPRGTQPERLIEGGPEGLRQFVRFDDRGRYRPLSGARTLRHDWRLVCAGPDELSEAIDVVYPLAEHHLDLYAAGRLQTASLEEVLGRQDGEAKKAVPGEVRAALQEALCGICVRVPLWEGPRKVGDGEIPCPEACSVLVALCRAALTWEVEQPRPAEVNDDAPFADFEDPGNEIRLAYLAARRRASSPSVATLESRAGRDAQ